MNVYYDSSLWCVKESSKKQAGECKCKQKINWAFDYLGQKCYVPYVYRFKKGIVFDVVTPISDESFSAYIEKSKTIDFSDEGQRRKLEEEHPYQPIHVYEIWINDEKIERRNGSSSNLYSPLQYDDSSINYTKKPRKKSAYEPESTCSASVGIIGGADGPTVMFLAGKAEKKDCFSKITFEAQEEAEFELKEMYITAAPRQIYEYERK